MSEVKLITLLGLGNKSEDGKYRYNSTVYRWDDGGSPQDSPETPYVAHALDAIFHPKEIVVLATERAEDAHGTALRELLPTIRIERIPDGKRSGELWEFFEILKSEIVQENADTEVILDITHGFRSLPFFTASVVAFLRATKPQFKSPKVVYGAYEGRRDGGPAPIWELTPFIEVVDAALELQIFLRTGQGVEVGERLRSLGREIRRNKRGVDVPPLEPLGKAILEFGEDFATVRVGNLIFGDKRGQSSAEKLAGWIERADGALREHAPPFADALDAVRDWVGSLRPQNADGAFLSREKLSREDAVHALGKLARAYLERGRYAEAIGVAREGAISAWDSIAFAAPASGTRTEGIDKAREVAEGRWRRHSNSKGLAEPRNDLLHAGFRNQPLAGDALSKQVETWVEKLVNIPVPTDVNVESSVRGLFLNLSNHPSSDWSEKQRTAAEALGQIKDVSFQEVDPNADAETVDEIARGIIRKIEDVLPNTTHAMVQGEMTLAFRLVHLLSDKGIICLAATTRREVVQGAGGCKTSRFEFVAFRRYL